MRAQILLHGVLEFLSTSAVDDFDHRRSLHELLMEIFIQRMDRVVNIESVEIDRWGIADLGRKNGGFMICMQETHIDSVP